MDGPESDGLDLKTGEDFAAELFHYGVPGMRWGVRNGQGTPTAVSVKEKPGKKVSTSGGKNQPASDDAKKAAVSKQKAKASTTDALSNKELQELVTRMNLEQQFSRLSQSNKSAGRQFVEKFFKSNEGKKTMSSVKKTVLDNASAASQLGEDLRTVKLD